jgi:hypothetical protein
MTNSSPRLLIKNGTLIDGSGRDPVTNTLVVVEGNRIVHIGGAAGSVRPETPDDTVIEAAGKFILPGLIDAHCHISLHQGALPGAKYTSSAEFCTLWAAYGINSSPAAGARNSPDWGRKPSGGEQALRHGRKSSSQETPRWRKPDSNSQSVVETNRQIAPWPRRFGMLSLDNFGSRSLYPPPLTTLAVCRRRREAADLGRE